MTVQETRPYLGGHRDLPGVTWLSSGKVRDIYSVDEETLLFVTTDRVSAFDVVMKEGIPDKGRVLTAIAGHWFERTKDIVENHLVSTSVDDVPRLTASWRDDLRGRVMLVHRAEPSSVEWVVRGYIAGSGWREYQRSETVCGIPLPAGLRLVDRLPAPILTPTTKDDDHDLPLTPEETRERVGEETYGKLERASLALFELGTKELAEIGILLADTKFEFGLLRGEWVVIDEMLTPDSSRFWPADAWTPGEHPPSYDKQILRNWLETLDWNKSAPPPPVDPEILDRCSRRYLEICRMITGRAPEGAES